MPGVPYTTGQVVGASDLNSMSGGTLGYAQITANSGTPGATPAVFAGMSTTVTQVVGRRLRVSAFAVMFASGGVYPTVAHLYIYSGGGPSQIQVAHQTMSAGNYWWDANISIILPNVAAGTVTYYLYGAVDSGTFGIQAGASAPSYIMVEDIGT